MPTPTHAQARGVTTLGVLLVVACRGQSTGPGDAGPELEGGDITAPDCNYTVRTATGAETPSLADGLVVGPAPGARHIHLGLAHDPARSMVVGWRTGDDATTDTELLYGTAEPDRSQTVITWRYRDRGGALLRMYEAHLCDLEPDTEYVYRIRSGDTLTEPERFRTAPDPVLDPDASVVLLALGDSRGNPEVLGELFDLADQSYTPDLLLFTGDAVQYGAAQEQWDAFLDQAEPLLRRIPTLITLGNHEAGDQIFTTLWALPGDEHWFGLDYGPVHLTVLDDSPYLYPDIDGNGESFLAQDLPTIAADRWKLVMHHQPIFTAESNDGHQPADRLRASWVPLFDQHGVDLVLAGHNHRYERSRPMRSDEDSSLGTVYVVTAGAGAPLYGAPLESWAEVAESTHHFVVLRVNRHALEASAVDLAGNLIDSFGLGR